MVTGIPSPFMKKFCLPTPFQENIDFNLDKERKAKMKATSLLVLSLSLFLFANLVEIWKGENFKKVTIGNCYFIGQERANV